MLIVAVSSGSLHHRGRNLKNLSATNKIIHSFRRRTCPPQVGTSANSNGEDFFQSSLDLVWSLVKLAISTALCRSDSEIRSRASAVRAGTIVDGFSSAGIDVRSRTSRLRNLICLKYRAHQVHTNRCNLSFRSSSSPSRRSSDSDIDGTISRQGCSVRNSHCLT